MIFTGCAWTAVIATEVSSPSCQLRSTVAPARVTMPQSDVETVDRRGHLRTDLVAGIEQFQCVHEDGVNELARHRGPDAERAVLGRVARAHDQRLVAHVELPGEQRAGRLREEGGEQGRDDAISR